MLFPVLAPWALVARTGPDISWEHFNSAGIPQYNVPQGFDIESNQAARLVCYHEPGHEFEEWLSRRDPTKAHRQKFLTLIGASLGWDAQKHLADLGTNPQMQHDLDPGEWWADAFADAVAGVPLVGPFLVQNTGPLVLRAFFQQLSGVTPAPVPSPKVPPIEFIPAASDRFTPGRQVVVDAIILHSTATTMQGAISTFQQGSRQVSAHVIVDVNRIVQCVDYEDTAWHAGSWPWNQRSIGVEHVDNADSWGPRPEKLYENAIEVSRSIHDAFPIQMFRRHEQIVATACPAGLDTDRIIDGVLMEMAFDPKANAADLAFLDKRIRDIIMNEPQLVGYALRRALIQYGMPAPKATTLVQAKGRRLPSRASVLRGHGKGK